MRRFFYKFPWLVWLYHLFLAFAGAVFYGFPGKKLFVIGVTGTKGKTTTAQLISSILEEAGKRIALSTSVFIKVGDECKFNTTENTMPGRFSLQAFLSRALTAGCSYAIVEVTSQGVVASRHRFIKWSAVVVTNIAREHIEAHGSFENYRAAKLSFLFEAKRNGAPIFLNEDDEPSAYFIEQIGSRNARLYSKVIAKEAFLKNERLMGEFSRENVAAAVAVVRHIGVSDATILRALQKFSGVPGRMEFVPWPGAISPRFEAVVDYAHTPDSLRAIYTVLREKLVRAAAPFADEFKTWNSGGATPSETALRPQGGLVCVLGACGGGRDRWKRPEMGKVAAEFCDRIILTDEDSYDEDPGTILQEIYNGIPLDKQNIVTKVLDRREALREGVRAAREGDIVVATGKGSELWIHAARGEKIPWSERRILEEAICEAMTR